MSFTANDDVVFILNPTQLTGGEKNYSYQLYDSFYKEEAKGWVNDTYYPREEMTLPSTYAKLDYKDQSYVISSLVWKETEFTGFGVYGYEDTTILRIPLDNDNYDVTITFYNPEDKPYSALVKAGNMVKAEDILVDSTTKDITFITCIVQNELNLKLLPTYKAAKKEEAIREEVYIKQIVIKRRPKNTKGKKPTLFLASDSTVQTYDKSTYPQTGWGEVLIHQFHNASSDMQANCPYPQGRVYESDTITIDNRAIGGRSSRSFLEEGRLDYILRDLKPGDYVFIQFGHNDATKQRPNRYVPSTEFAKYITYYIDAIKQRHGIPVLVTPVARRNCDEVTGEFRISFGNYRDVMFELSKEHLIPLLDLGKASTDYCNKIGPEESKKLFLWVLKGEYPDSKYAEGVCDNTHLQRAGANAFASLLVQLIKNYDKDNQLDPLKNLLTN